VNFIRASQLYDPVSGPCKDTLEAARLHWQTTAEKINGGHHE